MPKRRVHIPALSRRERQVMDILFRRGKATVNEVMEELPNPPTYSAVRSILRILLDKGHVINRAEGLRYVYLPAKDAGHFRDEALKHVIRTFFDGSTDQAIAAVLRMSDGKLSAESIAQLQQHIRKARSEGD